jgi:hypothetical protein
MTKLNSPSIVKYVTCWLESFDGHSTGSDSDSDKENLDSCTYNRGSESCRSETDAGSVVGLFIQMEFIEG